VKILIRIFKTGPGSENPDPDFQKQDPEVKILVRISETGLGIENPCPDFGNRIRN
jgi:hypothetical protein